jgi:hypothetical protein
VAPPTAAEAPAVMLPPAPAAGAPAPTNAAAAAAAAPIASSQEGWAVAGYSWPAGGTLEDWCSSQEDDW